MTPEQRRTHLGATISAPNDAGRVALLGGEQLGRCISSTKQQLGFDACSFGLLRPDGSALWPIAQAEEIDAGWWLTVFRLYADGEKCWEGRIWDVDLYGDAEDPVLGHACAIDIVCRGGAYTELTNGTPVLPDAMTAEDATVTYSDLVETVITQSGGLIALDFSRVVPSSTNLGPINVADQDQPLDLVTRYARVGDGNAEEQTFLVFELDRGPIAGPLCDDGAHVLPKYVLPIIGSGIRRTRRGDQRANRIKTVYSGADDTSGVLDPISDGDALYRQFNLIRERTFSVQGVSADAAAAMAAAALALKADPIGMTGDPVLRADESEACASITTLEGSRVPSHRVHAGDVLRVERSRPHNPLAKVEPNGLLAIVQATRMDWDAGTCTLTLDQRRIASRPEEDQAAITAARRALTPGAPHSSGGVVTSTDSTTIPTDTTKPLNNGEITRHISRTGRHKITISVQVRTTTASTGDNTWLGYTLDGETPTYTDTTTFHPFRWNHDNANDTNTFSADFYRWLTRGEHRFLVHVRQDSGSNYTGQVTNVAFAD